MRRGRTRPLLVASLALLAMCVQACNGDDESGPSPTPDTTSDALGCGLVDEDVVVEAIGTDVTSSGTGILPPDQAEAGVMTCDISVVGNSLTFMTIRVDIPESAELEQDKASWPETAADMDCKGAWVAPEEGSYGAACVDNDAPPGAKATNMRALFGEYAVNVSIIRPKPRAQDAETAYAVSQNVADHLPN